MAMIECAPTPRVQTPQPETPSRTSQPAEITLNSEGFAWVRLQREPTDVSSQSQLSLPSLCVEIEK